LSGWHRCVWCKQTWRNLHTKFKDLALFEHQPGELETRSYALRRCVSP
jgi:hypothetical protein